MATLAEAELASGRPAAAAGRVTAAQNNSESARRHLGFALDVFTRLELPFETANTELDLARLFQPVDPEAAAARARSALARLEALGAQSEAAEAAAVLRSLGVTPPPGPRRAELLSARESDVLSLLAQGLTNPQIAGRLYLSPRTVGHHVSSILLKLGLQSRSFAAREATAPRHPV